jgi:alpha-pyrone synthase
MSYILNISTTVPDYQIEPFEMLSFYSDAFLGDKVQLKEKLAFLIKKTKIRTRYSCIPDFKGIETELFLDNNYLPSVERRMDIYKSKVLPLASKAIQQVFHESEIPCEDITHFITVSCTGIMAPGLELTLAEAFGLEHTEKSALNFLGCYAALKAIKQADYIAKACPEACILIVCAELCSIHFNPSVLPDDIISNLLFSDGAAALIVCGAKNKYLENRIVLSIDKVGSAFIPQSSEHMKWDISSSAFKMVLRPQVVSAIKENILDVVDRFLLQERKAIDYWAIHPGGLKIVEAVQLGLGLNDQNVSESMAIMEQFGNMSSPTILFVLNSIFEKIKASHPEEEKTIFSCAFGPGLNIEMVGFTAHPARKKNTNKSQFIEKETEVLTNCL